MFDKLKARYRAQKNEDEWVEATTGELSKIMDQRWYLLVISHDENEDCIKAIAGKYDFIVSDEPVNIDFKKDGFEIVSSGHYNVEISRLKKALEQLYFGTLTIESA